MATAIFVFIAIAFGLMLFASLQDKIPDELAFLKDKPVPKTVAGAKVQQYKGWTIAETSSAVEISRYAESNKVLVGVLCHDNTLEARVEAADVTTGTTSSEVSINGLPSQQWAKGSGNNLFPGSAADLVSSMLQAPTLVVQISYKTTGLQKATFATDGLKELIGQLPAGCRV